MIWGILKYDFTNCISEYWLNDTFNHIQESISVYNEEKHYDSRDEY